MKSTIRITDNQIKSMYSYLASINDIGNSSKKNLGLYYNLLTPAFIYVKYTTYSVEDDNSISSEVILLKIKPNGEVVDCEGVFHNLNQRLEFESKLIEIDLDANKNIIFK